TPLDAGTGQVQLMVNAASGPEIEAVEILQAIANARINSANPIRTPRFLTQVVVTDFHADVRMFFGLRETLGDAIPDIVNEECAGFDWDGSNFRAISSDGGGAGVSTNLATPSEGPMVQLEVIVLSQVQVEFYVNGVLVATHDTAAGIPTVNIDWQHLLNNYTGGGGAGIVYVTVANGGVQQCPA
ncbi:unnamed protein product, partial [marine sediment metagenome]